MGLFKVSNRFQGPIDLRLIEGIDQITVGFGVLIGSIGLPKAVSSMSRNKMRAVSRGGARS